MLRVAAWKQTVLEVDQCVYPCYCFRWTWRMVGVPLIEDGWWRSSSQCSRTSPCGRSRHSHSRNEMNRTGFTVFSPDFLTHMTVLIHKWRNGPLLYHLGGPYAYTVLGVWDEQGVNFDLLHIINGVVYSQGSGSNTNRNRGLLAVLAIEEHVEKWKSEEATMS
jgi:hypothetical protein